MINFVVLGKNKKTVIAVLQAIRSYTDAKSIVVGSEETRGLRWSSLCETQATLQLNGADDERFLALLHQLVQRTPHVVLIPADYHGIRMTNRLRARLPVRVVRTPDEAALASFADKSRFHQLCRQLQLSVPDTTLVSAPGPGDFEQLACSLGLPFVVKPAGADGCFEHLTVNHREDWLRALQAQPQSPLLAQRYIHGREISITLLADRGQVRACALATRSISKTSFVDHPELQAMAARLCHAAAFDGALHLRARIEKGSERLFLIDAAPHFGPALAASVGCGLNLVAESIEASRRARGALCLTQGTWLACHPLLHPSLWSRLLFDSSESGRLLRAMSFDLYTLADLARAGIAVTIRAAAQRLAAKPSKLRGTLLRPGAANADALPQPAVARETGNSFARYY